jgi:BolA protein
MTLVSPNFEGMSLIERHQLVYKALDEYMHGEIHALTMKTYTPEEHQKTLDNS